MHLAPIFFRGVTVGGIMNSKKAFGFALVVASLGGALAGFGGGCSDTTNNTGPTPTTTNTGAGLCLGTCDKPCAADQDCNTSSGELCCDFGNGGKICQNAKVCPRFC